ncbi:hypothetical protein [Clostridium sp. DL-VIII]|uniref:hypothetical protein n=1 Tax=Clostridium sp. DL-VIII TaxID=641107 RepID=UPI001641A0D1|nr:hypothetical protein [Clostridium sp. DL-VIII]
MIQNGFSIKKTLVEKSILLLDRYFLSVPALIALNKLNEENGSLLQIVTKATVASYLRKNIFRIMCKNTN